MNIQTVDVYQVPIGEMLKNFLKVLLLFNFLNPSIAQSDLDEALREIIIKNDLKPLDAPARSPKDLTRLGAMLFSNKLLSGPKSMSCADCHHPGLGTTDGIAFSLGVEAQTNPDITPNITKRNSPPVFNLGYDDIPFMFWDGRVHYDKESKVFTTPEPALNGDNPKRADITKVMTSALAAQTIFPIANHLEMRGTSGNPIADAKGNLGAWQEVLKRLLKNNPRSDRYMAQFKKAYPGETNFNIGHVGEALGSFIKDSFTLVDTPYDRYLKGDSSALKPSEKRGLIVFAGRGKCIKCHNGRHLSNFEFKTVATPQLTPEGYPEPYDQGRFEVTGVKSDLFKFRTPALRNVALTSPYMHNGSLRTLEEVIDHYNDPSLSLENYDLTGADLSMYPAQNFVIDRDARRNKLRVNLISIGEVRRGIKLTEDEKKDLISFLKRGLLDYRFHRQWSF